MKRDEIFIKAYCSLPKKDIIDIIHSFEELKNKLEIEQEGFMTENRKRYLKDLEEKIELLNKAYNNGR